MLTEEDLSRINAGYSTEGFVPELVEMMNKYARIYKTPQLFVNQMVNHMDFFRIHPDWAQADLIAFYNDHHNS